MAQTDAVELSPAQMIFLERYVLDLPGRPDRADTAEAEPDFSAFNRAWPVARQRWQDASDAVDAQIAQLQTLLRGETDADLNGIGALGVNAITGNTRVALAVALFDIDRAAGRPAPAQIARARTAIGALAKHLASDPRIHACDANPFGVRMSIAATLGGALRDLKAALDAAPDG